MHEQFQLLRILQEVDDHLQSLEAQEQQLPQRLQPYEAACATARQQLTQSQSALEQSDRHQRACERELANHQEALRKTQSKTHAVKTNDEYRALLAEMEASKQRLEALEDEILTLMEAAESQRQAQKQQEQQVQAAVHILTAQQQEIAQARAVLRQAMEVTQARRHETVAQLDASLYAQYAKIAAQQHGRVLTQVQEGVCSGCYLKLPPQLISEIRTQTQVFTCPHCRRLLLWPA